MWCEIVNAKGDVIGAVNTDSCDLMRIDPNDRRGSQGGALMRSHCSVIEGDRGVTQAEVYKTRVSYLRIIETLTQSEIKSVQHIADLVKEDAHKANAPRIVMP